MLPFAILLPGQRPPGGGFVWDFALALGYSGLAMMGVQFWLTARFKRLSAPFGIDILYFFHRYLALVAFAVLLLHVALLLWRYAGAVGSPHPLRAPGYMTAGWLGVIGFALLLTSSLWRKQIGIEYDRWRRWHVLLAVLATVAAVLHVLGAGNYLQDPIKRLAWSLLALSWLALVIYVRLIRPWQLRHTTYVVQSVKHEAGRSWTLRLRPQQGKRLDYRAGQFAWLTLRASPFALREHPFSFSSSPDLPDAVEFTIKELGDFTRSIGSIRPGETATIDGPYGSFGADRHPEARVLLFVAGGVGIAPIISQLRALAAHGDRRPMWLFYGNRRWDHVVFRDALDALSKQLPLRVVHVLGEPPPQWPGERGFITREMLAKHLPESLDGLHAFVCGPAPMIRSVEDSLRNLGVPLDGCHSEIFDLA